MLAGSMSGKWTKVFNLFNSQRKAIIENKWNFSDHKRDRIL